MGGTDPDPVGYFCLRVEGPDGIKTTEKTGRESRASASPALQQPKLPAQNSTGFTNLSCKFCPTGLSLKLTSCSPSAKALFLPRSAWGPSHPDPRTDSHTLCPWGGKSGTSGSGGQLCVPSLKASPISHVWTSCCSAQSFILAQV